tara:strand:- start:5274 stop:8093 length:2820 start_codon:yes stop_codon:yes gene_type:complete
MQRLQFQGYAQRKNNLGWQIPDNLRAMQDETERTLRGMREYQQQLNQNRKEYLAGMKENARLQEANVKENQNLEEEFAEAYQEAELQHYEQRLADVKPGGGLYQDSQNLQERLNAKEGVFDQLVRLAPSMAKNVATLNEAHKVKMKAIGTEIATRWNLSHLELAALKNGDRQVDWVHKAISRVERRLQENGASASERKAVLGLSGRKMLGAQIYAVSNLGGVPYAQHYRFRDEETGFDMRTHQWKEGGVNLGSLYDHEIGAEGTSDESFRAIQRLIRTDYLKRLQDPETGESIYDSKFLSAHLTPGLEKVEAEFFAQQAQRTTDKLEEDSLNEATVALKAYIKGYGGADRHLALPRWINTEAVKPEDRGRVRDRAFALLAQMASTGELTRAEFADMMNGDVILGDPGKGGKPQRAGSIWGDQAQQVYKALDDRDKRSNQVIETRKKAFDNQMKGEMANAALSMGRNLNKWEIDKIEDLYLQNNYQVPQWLEKYKSAEEMSKEDSKYELDSRVAEGTLTMAELYSGRYDSSLLKGYEKDTINGPGAISQEARREYVGSVKSSISQAVNSIIVDSDQRSSQTRIMSGKAIKMLNERVREATIAGIYNTATDAWVQESNKLRKEIDNGEGIFAPKKDAGGNVLVGKEGGFQYLEDALQFDRVGIEYRKKASEDKNFIYTPGSISQKELQAIADVPSGKPIPGFIFQLDQVYPHKDPYDIMNIMLEANGGKPIERPGLAKVREFVHPTVSDLVTRKGTSQARTSRAVEATMKMTEQENEAISPMLQMLKSKAVMTIDPENEGYDAISTSRGIATGTSQYNKPLMEMTVGEVDALQRRDGVQLGAYQIDARTLQHYINKGWIKKDEMFDSLLQNRLARWQMHRTSGLFQTSDGVDIPGLGQDTSGWKPTKDPEKDNKIKDGLAAIGIESWKLKDNLFSEYLGVA